MVSLRFEQQHPTRQTPQFHLPWLLAKIFPLFDTNKGYGLSQNSPLSSSDQISRLILESGGLCNTLCASHLLEHGCENEMAHVSCKGK